MEFLEIMAAHCSSSVPMVVRGHALSVHPYPSHEDREGQKVGRKCRKEGWTDGRKSEGEQMRGEGKEEGVLG